MAKRYPDYVQNQVPLYYMREELREKMQNIRRSAKNPRFFCGLWLGGAAFHFFEIGRMTIYQNGTIRRELPAFLLTFTKYMKTKLNQLKKLYDNRHKCCGGFFYARKQINRRFELENIYITAHDGQVG